MEYDANAYFEGLTFTRMVSGQFNNPLTISSNLSHGDTGHYSIRHCRFTRNTGNTIATMYGPQMRFLNNLVADNTLSGAGAAAVLIGHAHDADSGAAINNNTIANNSGGAGLNVESSDTSVSARQTEIADNIIWGNGSPNVRLSDFDSASNSLLMHYNLYGSVAGYNPPSSNLTSNPQFINAGAGNYGLAPSSPGINSGAAYQYYGFKDFDLAGNNRIVGSAIDRGALESSIDDRTSFVVTNTGDNGNNGAPLTGSLRAAIRAANLATQPFKISFAIPGACPRIIQMSTAMLDVTGDVTIDARTQNGWSANTDYGRFDASLCLVANGSGTTPYALHVPSGATDARLTVHGMMFAGFSDAAIRLEGGANHRISGNQFGAVPFTSANGSAIRVTGASGGAYIGGFDDPPAVNLIAGSSSAGIYLDNASGGSTLGNNVIGFQVDGTSRGDNNIGVFIFNSPGNEVFNNYISNSETNGVTISGAASNGTTLRYNLIGVDWTLGVPGNQGAGVGIVFGAQNSTIGAPSSSGFGGNRISGNLGPGVWISPSGGSGNRVLGNQFFDNQSVDIDFGTAGPTPNQANNPVPGPNHLQNYPILTSAVRSGVANPIATVSGSLHSAPNSNYRIDVYAGPACDTTAPGRGTAELYLGRAIVATNASGDASLNIALPAPTSLSFDTVSATATSAAGDTSELGNCINLVSGTLPNAVFANGFE
jgi:hypothetical protein